MAEDLPEAVPETLPEQLPEGALPRLPPLRPRRGVWQRGGALLGLGVLVLAGVGAGLRGESSTSRPAPDPLPTSALLGGPPAGACLADLPPSAPPGSVPPSAPGAAPPALPASAAARLQLKSAPGEDVLGGCGLDLVSTAVEFEVSLVREVLRIQAGPPSQRVVVTFAPPPGERLTPGKRYEAVRTSFRGATAGVETLFLGRGCPELRGTFTFEKLERRGSQVSSLRGSFEQQCAGSANPLRGTLEYTLSPASTTTAAG